MSMLRSTLAAIITTCSFAQPASPGQVWQPDGEGVAARVDNTKAPAPDPVAPPGKEPTPRDSEDPPRRLEQAIRTFSAGSMLYVPTGFHAERDGAFDLVIHFHGGAQVVEPSFIRAGLNAALVTVNLGVGSGAYQDAYQDPTRLENTLTWVRTNVKQRAGISNAHVQRLALSAWSAGYGAVARILPQRHSVDIDAVLLADGLHAAYVDARKRTIDPVRMAPFVRFAADAVSGKKLMGVTHSAIETYGYASTTETAAYLLEHADMRAEPDDGLDAPGLFRKSSAARGELYVRGFQGTTKEDHCAHVRSLGQTLFPMLAGFWSR